VKNLVLIRIDALGLFLSSGATNWCEKMRFVLAFPLSWPCTYYHAKEFNQEADRLTESIYGNNHSQWTGETDAFRHCYWSCIMTVSASPEFSRTIANIHEECHPDESIGSHNMDYYNNIQGRSLGIESKTWKDCENKCHKAFVSGTLRTSYRTDEQEDPLLQTLNEIL